MASHTPGPWEIGEEQFGAQVMVFAGEREVADCGHNFSDCGNEEDRANARLIAAAPELLAALDRLLETVEDEMVGLIDRKTIRARKVANITEARAAIRAARGE